MDYVALISAGLQILLLLFKEYFSASARAREEEKQFILDQAQLKKIVDAAVIKWNASNAKDSDDADNAWDEADKEKKL